MFCVAQMQMLATVVAGPCSFCAEDASGFGVTFDLSSLPTTTYSAADSRGPATPVYSISQPCGVVLTPFCGLQSEPVTQGCKGTGMRANASVALAPNGVTVT